MQLAVAAAASFFAHRALFYIAFTVNSFTAPDSIRRLEEESRAA
jgi:hypothetical protein